MKVICIEEEAFFQLIEQTLERLGNTSQPLPRWIGEEEAMQLLHVRSKTTIQKLRNDGKIRFSQPMHKVILYDRESIMKLIEDNTRETF